MKREQDERSFLGKKGIYGSVGHRFIPSLRMGLRAADRVTDTMREFYRRQGNGKGLVHILLLVLALPSLGVIETQAQGKIDPAMWVHEAQAVYTRIDNYTATFHKQERVDGKLLEEETVLLKFKKPFKVYMRWTHMPHKGRELIYARDWNDNRMRAHEGGIIGIITMNLDPKGSLAMRGNRHPVTDTGIGHLLDVVAENLQKGTLTGELTLLDRGKETIYGKRTRRIQAIFPKDQTKGYYGYRVSVNFDVENRLPIKVEIHDWDDQLVEKYGYEDLKLNPGLTDSDFDPKNPEYRF